jgi:hypothetical protein
MTPPYHLGYFSKQSFEYVFAHRVAGDIVSYETRGKTVDLAFLFYKLNQMSRWLMPEFILNRMAKSRLGRVKIYIPSNDIAYIAVRKPLDHPTLIEKKN